MRDVARQIDNEKDFKDYVLSYSNRAGVKPTEIKYQQHPVSLRFIHTPIFADFCAGSGAASASPLVPN